MENVGYAVPSLLLQHVMADYERAAARQHGAVQHAVQVCEAVQQAVQTTEAVQVAQGTTAATGAVLPQGITQHQQGSTQGGTPGRQNGTQAAVAGGTRGRAGKVRPEGQCSPAGNMLQEPTGTNVSSGPGTVASSQVPASDSSISSSTDTAGSSSVGSSGKSTSGSSGGALQLGGMPYLGLRWQAIESDALAEYLGLGRGATSGIHVTRVDPSASAAGAIQEGDVLLSLGG